MDIKTTLSSGLLITTGILMSSMGASSASATDWIAGSGNYGVSSNWNPSDVPCDTGENANIPAAGITVTQDVIACAVSGLTLGEGVTFNLMPATAYDAIAADVNGAVSGSGNLTVSTTALTGPEAYVSGSNGAQISLQNATSSATDTRFSATSGAVLDIHLGTLTSTTPENFSATILSATGSGSRLELPAATTLNSAFNSTIGSAQFHQVVASDGGVVDLSGVTSVIGPVDDEDYLYFVVSDTSFINLDSLQSVTADGYVLFSTLAGGSLFLPALQNTQDAVFVVDEADGQILANASAWTFSSTGRPNSNTTLVRANGSGTLVDLSGMTTLNAGFDSTIGSAQFHQIVASNGGVVDLSGVTSATGPTDDEDYLYVVASDTAAINLDSLQTVTAGGYVLFSTLAGGVLSLPSLLNTQDAFFIVDEPGGQILANASTWTFSSIERPNSNATLARANGLGALVDLSGMTTLNAGFNSTIGSAQFHQIVASNGGVVNLSGVTSATGPTDDEDYLYIVVSDTASINLDSLHSVTAGGYVLFSTLAGGVLSLPSLLNTQDAFFIVDEPGGQILANASTWTFSSTERPNSNATLARANGLGALVDLSGMTTLNAGFNSSIGSAQFHQVVASNGGVVDLSQVTSVTGPADDEDYLHVVISDTASINLDSLQTVTAGGYVLFSALAGGTLSLPMLQNTQDAIFTVDEPDGQILANASSWTFSSTGRPNSNTVLARANGLGALVDLSGMTALNAGFNSSIGSAQVHSVTAINGGVVDITGANLIIGPVDSEDRLDFTVSDGGTLVLGPLDNITDDSNVALNLNLGGTAEFPLSINADNTISVQSVTESNVIVTGDLSFTHSDEARFNLEAARVTVEGAGAVDIEIGGSNLGTGPLVLPNFGFAQLIIGNGAQATNARLIDIVDNGNGNICGVTGIEREALYLYGFDFGVDADGLRILNGSTLELGGFDLYAAIGGVIMHINAMVVPGVPFPYDEGFITLDTVFDIDMDGVADGNDNCVLVPNPDQTDTDQDGYGNACDGDLNGDLLVNGLDLFAFSQAFLSTPISPNWNADADFNVDNVVNFFDFFIMVQQFLAPPGPACPVPTRSKNHTIDTREHSDTDKLIKEFWADYQ